MTREEIEEITTKTLEYLGGYAFTDDNRNVHLPTLMHDFLNDSRVYFDEFINVSLPSNLDEAAEEALDDEDANWQIDERDDGCTEPGYNQKQMLIMFKAGAEWMAEQGWHEEAVIKGSDDVVWLNYNVELPIDLAKYFKVGDKVIVQIRKAK